MNSKGNGSAFNWVLGILVALSLVFSGIAAFGGEEVKATGLSESDNKMLTDIANGFVSVKSELGSLKADVAALKQDNSTPVVASSSSDAKLDKLLAEYSDDEEAKALALARDEVSSRDFRKLVVQLLNNNSISNQSVESYKDVVVFVRDSDVDVSGTDGTVDLELKVTFFNDGDSDSEDAEKALVNVSFEVSDLDSDEGFEDAEVDGYDVSDLELVKIYSN